MAKKQKPTQPPAETPEEHTPARPLKAPTQTDRPAFTPGKGVDQDHGVEDDEDVHDPHPSRRGKSDFDFRLVQLTGGTVLVVLVLLIVFAAMDRPDVRPVRLGGPGATVALTDSNGVPIANGDAPANGEAPTARNLPALGDVLRITITAADDPLNPIRITEEGDVRRPYWVEQGDSISFPMRERITIEEPEEGRVELDQARIRVNGVLWPSDRRDSRGRIVITRQAVEDYFNQLRRGGS